MAEVDWEHLREDLTALIERFTAQAEAVGAKAYRAQDAEEARRIVSDC